MITFITIAVFIAVAIGCLVFIASKGIPRKVSQLERPLSDLLMLETKTGFLIIDHKKSEKFVQFEKYTYNRDLFGIELSFPDVKWSKPYIEKLKSYCQAEGIEFDLTRGSDGTEFLVVDYKKDVKGAYRDLRYIILNIFNLSEEDKFYTLLEYSGHKI